jgi:hypothetical protein
VYENPHLEDTFSPGVEARDDEDHCDDERNNPIMSEQPRRLEQPKKRRNKYKDIAHKKPEVLVLPSYDSRDDQSSFEEDDHDSYTHGTGSYSGEDDTFHSSGSQELTSDSEEEEEETENEEAVTQMVDTLFEIESKLSLSACSSADHSECSEHSSNCQETRDGHDGVEEEEEEGDDSGIGDEVDSDEEEEVGPFFASFCQRIPSEDGEVDEERTSRKGRYHEETQNQVPSILKCVSGYFVQVGEEEVEDSDHSHSEDEEQEADDDSTRRESRRESRQEERRRTRREERRSRRRDDMRRSSHRHRRRSRH